MGLADVLTRADHLREGAIEPAADITAAAPLAAESTRMTLRLGLAEAVENQLEREFAEQLRLAPTRDHAEGVKAVMERRPGNFTRS